jgi:hypothetical protein
MHNDLTVCVTNFAPAELFISDVLATGIFGAITISRLTSIFFHENIE